MFERGLHALYPAFATERCLDTENRVFVFGRKTGKRKEKRKIKKKLPRNRLSFTHAQTKPPRATNFVYTLTRKRMTAIVFEEIFRIGFQVASRSKLFCVHRVKLVFLFPRPFSPMFIPHFFPHFFSPTYDGILSIHHGYRTGIRPSLIRNIEFSRSSEKRHFLFHYFRGHTIG